MLNGKVTIEPFVERVPMSRVNDALARIRGKQIKRRVVLEPDFKSDSSHASRDS